MKGRIGAWVALAVLWAGVGLPARGAVYQYELVGEGLQVGPAINNSGKVAYWVRSADGMGPSILVWDGGQTRVAITSPAGSSAYSHPLINDSDRVVATFNQIPPEGSPFGHLPVTKRKFPILIAARRTHVGASSETICGEAWTGIGEGSRFVKGAAS